MWALMLTKCSTFRVSRNGRRFTLDSHARYCIQRWSEHTGSHLLPVSAVQVVQDPVHSSTRVYNKPACLRAFAGISALSIHRPVVIESICHNIQMPLAIKTFQAYPDMLQDLPTSAMRTLRLSHTTRGQPTPYTSPPSTAAASSNLILRTLASACPSPGSSCCNPATTLRKFSTSPNKTALSFSPNPFPIGSSAAFTTTFAGSCGCVCEFCRAAGSPGRQRRTRDDGSRSPRLALRLRKTTATIRTLR